MPDRYRALVTLAAGTGLRQGECFGLSVDRCDFLRRSITVDRQMVLAGSGPPRFGPPKTEASVRTVPLPQVVADALAGHLEQRGTGPDGLIFTRLGHASASETLDTYAHLWPDNEDRTRAAVDRILGQAGNVERRSG